MQIGFTHVSPGNTDTKTLQMQREVPLETDAPGTPGDGATQERHHLGGAHQKIRLALDLEGREERIGCSQYRALPRGSCFLSAEEQPESVPKGARRSAPCPLHQS